MDLLGKQINKHVSEGTSMNQLGRVVNLPVAPSGDPPTFTSEAAKVALELVSEVAEGIKCAEDRAADMVARAQSLATNAAEKVRLTEARIERAEVAKRQAESSAKGPTQES